jgi:dTDP-4-dehydrorhamnose reductase
VVGCSLIKISGEGETLPYIIRGNPVPGEYGSPFLELGFENMRWMILGAAGQLGRELTNRLGHLAIPITRAEADLSLPENIEKVLDKFKPRAVINCAAYNLVDKAEEQVREAFTTNCWAPGEAAGLCAARSIPFVHLSTDHVFGGMPASCPKEGQPRAWLENDAPMPLGIYALSKLSGEHLVRMRNANSWVIRTCGLYGRHGTGGKGSNFVETMLRLAREGKIIRVVSDQWCTPTPVRDLAPTILEVVEKMAPGLYHLTSAGQCTWHEFAQAIFDEVGHPVRVQPISSAEFGARARRPAWSVLETMHHGSMGMPRLRHWREGLASYLKEDRQGR